MSEIRWDEPFYVNLLNGEVSETPQQGYVAFPEYGNYGGPFNPNPGEILPPKDIIDFFFLIHDVQIAQAGPGYTANHALADINLISNLTYTDTSYDPEASLYDAAATVAMVQRLVVHDQLGLISPFLLVAALVDAANDLKYGLENLPAAEQSQALQFLFGPPDQNGVYELQFTFPTIPILGEPLQEYVEFVAVFTIAANINEPWQGDTGPILFGGDDYILRFDAPNSDLDLLPVPSTS
jgi:hypothetical protein